jgi:glycerophosphoryl diester phosphodiesterase
MVKSAGHNLTLLVILSILISVGCSTAKKATTNKYSVSFYKVGHRGTRGLMPENTIPAMEKGIAVGANTIEFDVHVTRDHKIVVYHDASFTPSYTTMPDGSDIPEAERSKYTFYQMDYAEIRKFIIGEKYYSTFPHQHLMKSYAPLLSEMIDSVEAFTRTGHYPPVHYLLEIKSYAATDGTQQPPPDEYIQILMKALKPKLKELKGRLIIQSFDMRPLQILHREYPAIPLGFLTYSDKVSFEENIKKLGFIPAFYNPVYNLVTQSLLNKCHAEDIKVLPWTVENVKDMQRLKDMAVDGIITDYPDRITELHIENKRSK